MENLQNYNSEPEGKVTFKISSEREIENLIAQYTHLLDAGDFAGVAGLFKKGQLLSLGEVIVGEKAVQELLYRNLRVYPNGTPQTAHLTTNTILKINAEGKSATASSYMTILQNDKETGFPLQAIMVGRYNDSFAYGEGAWYFTERELSLSLLGDFSHHANVAVPSENI